MKEKKDTVTTLADHLFRRESGRMVAVLTQIFGSAYIQVAEDVVQETFLTAFKHWIQNGIPDNPSGWLFSVAKNKAIDIIRRNKYSTQFDFSGDKILLISGYSLEPAIDEYFQEKSIDDNMLSMMFACCHPALPEEAQISIILKLLCGFSTAEIAKAYLTSEDVISKRIYRAKQFLRENKISLILPGTSEIAQRTSVVLNTIYLLFNEGYNSTNNGDPIRQDLIEEAMILCKLLSENKHTQLPETFALMALICFQAARSNSRLTPEGQLILLTEQDRSRWDFEMISLGNDYMNKAAFGSIVSTYHLEAAIAFEYCIPKTFSQTDWARIVKLHDWLCRIHPSPVRELNRVVALLNLKGAQSALIALQNIQSKDKLQSYHLYHSVLGEIFHRLNLTSEAVKCFEKAIDLTGSDSERALLKTKIDSIKKANLNW